MDLDIDMFGIPTEVLVTMGSAVGSWWLKKKSQDAADLRAERELNIQVREQTSTLMDAAAKRSSPWTRKFVAVTVILVCFVGLFIVAFFPNIPVTLVQEVPQKEFLFGLFKWGSTTELLEARGFVLPGWVRYSICTIIGFLFGPSFAKTK